MTENQLQRRVEQWQSRLALLGVSQWRIESVEIVDETPGGPNADATVCTSSKYDSAYFYFARDFIETATPATLDETIIHEWLHVAMRDLDRTLDCVENWMPEQTHTDFDRTVDRAREALIERLARTIYALAE